MFKNIIQIESLNNPINYSIEFNIGNDTFSFLFNVKNKTFIYYIVLKKIRKIWKNSTTDIVDNNIKYSFWKFNFYRTFKTK
jgi:hypothetical protein